MKLFGESAFRNLAYIAANYTKLNRAGVKIVQAATQDYKQI